MVSWPIAVTRPRRLPGVSVLSDERVVRFCVRMGKISLEKSENVPNRLVTGGSEKFGELGGDPTGPRCYPVLLRLPGGLGSHNLLIYRKIDVLLLSRESFISIGKSFILLGKSF